MANTITNLLSDFYAAMDVVSRELVGAIPSVARDPSADRCALNASMRSPITRANTSAADITAAMSIPSAGDQTIDNVAFTIQKSRFTKFSWTGEEEYSLDTAGAGALNIQQDQIAQAIRALTNEIENDICDYAALGASRAYGTAGTTPFDSSNKLAFTAQLKKILDDHSTPENVVESIFIRVLARRPTSEEMAAMLKIVAEGKPPAVYEDIFAGLLISSEFMFNH